MKEIKYEGRYMRITEEDTGGHIYERVTLRPGVSVIPYHDGKILLIKEYRAHEGGERWKLVSGWLDKKDYSPEEIAKEEMAEEIGMGAKRWEQMPYFDTEDNTVNPRIYHFIAHDPYELTEKPENPDGDVILETKWVTEEEFQQMLTNQDLRWDRDALYALQSFKVQK